MSRRRPTQPAPITRRTPKSPSGKRAGLFPADLRVSLHVKDPAGHRLVTFARLLDEADPRRVTWDGDSLGPQVRFLADEDQAGDWTRLVFACKACRDQGRDPWTETHLDVVALRLDQLRTIAGDTPKHDELTTVPIVGM